LGATWIPYSMVIPLAWSLLFIGLGLQARGITSRQTLKVNWRERRLIDIEIVGVIAVVSLAPTLVFAFPQPTAGIYFLNIQHWVALAFTLGLWPQLAIRPLTGFGK